MIDAKSYYSLISPRLHYLSIAVYIVCIGQCIFGVLGTIPYLCQYYMANIRVFMFGYSKGLIMLFQVQRLILCFGNNWYFTSLTIVVCFGLILGTYFAFIQVHSHFNISRYYGCWLATNELHSVQMVAIIILVDWIVLLTYYIKIERIKRRWNKLHDQMVASRSASSDSNDVNIVNNKTQQNPNGKNTTNDNYNNNNDVSRRLNLILKKILFLSLLMEIPFILAAIFHIVGKVGTIESMISYIFMATDSATNIILVSYMLEYNKDKFGDFLTKYNRFIKYFKCLNCLLFEMNPNGTVPIKHGNDDKDRKIQTEKEKELVECDDKSQFSTSTTPHDEHADIAIKSVLHSALSQDENHHFVHL